MPPKQALKPKNPSESKKPKIKGVHLLGPAPPQQPKQPQAKKQKVDLRNTSPAPEVKEAPKRKKASDIDDIFGALKRPSLSTPPPSSGKQSSQSTSDPQSSNQQFPDDDDDFADSRGLKRKRKYTEEGYPIYTEEELRIGLGGDTPDCPFDCSCCY